MLKRLLAGAMLAVMVLPVAAKEGDYLFDTLKRPVWRKAWNNMLASGGRMPEWIGVFSRTYNGVATPASLVNIGDKTYELATVCKPHDCGDNQLYVLFKSDGLQAFGLLLQTGKPQRFLGAPDAAQQAALVQGAAQ